MSSRMHTYTLGARPFMGWHELELQATSSANEQSLLQNPVWSQIDKPDFLLCQTGPHSIAHPANENPHAN